MAIAAYAHYHHSHPRELWCAVITDATRVAFLFAGGRRAWPMNRQMLQALSIRCAIGLAAPPHSLDDVVYALSYHLSSGFIVGQERDTFDDAVERARALLMAQDGHRFGPEEYPLVDPIPIPITR